MEIEKYTNSETSYELEYGNLTPLEVAEYQFATIEYDYIIHPDAAKSIRAIFKDLYNEL